MSSLERIALTSLETDDRWSLHQSLVQEPPPELLESIKQFGIFHPPIIHSGSAGRFAIISGNRRIKAARLFLHQTELICHVLPEKQEPEQLLRTVLEEQRLSGHLSPIERGQFVELCHRLLTPDHASALLRSCRLGNAGSLARACKLLSLELPIRQAIHDGRLGEKVGHELLLLTSEDQLALLELFGELGLNHNKQRRAIELIRIICSAENRTIASFIGMQEQELFDHSWAGNKPQAAARYLDQLSRQAQPLATQAEESFQRQIQSLNLPANMLITHAPAFETDAVTLHITFDSLKNLQQTIDVLRHLPNK